MASEPKKRKTKYSKQMAEDAEKYAASGMIDQEIADKLGIARSTLSRYKLEHEEFKEALDRGKEVVDDKVEASLLKRALGFEYEETQVIADETGHPVKFVKTKKVFPPDVTAQIYWLKNRRREKWKDKWDVDVNTDREITFNIVPASEKEE